MSVFLLLLLKSQWRIRLVLSAFTQHDGRRPPRNGDGLCHRHRGTNEAPRPDVRNARCPIAHGERPRDAPHQPRQLAGTLKSIRTIHEYADRASNTFRRLMLILAEYRKPPRVGDSFTAIGQANIAGQQVVVNGGQENGNATNEQGSDQQGTGHDAIDHDAPTNATHTPPALSAEPRGPGIPPSLGSSDPARIQTATKHSEKMPSLKACSAITPGSIRSTIGTRSWK